MSLGKRMAKMHIAKSLAILAGVTLASCGLTNREFSPGMTFGNEREKTEARFFIGSDWFDSNKNGRVEGCEINSKREYGLNDRITIIADLQGYEGELTTRIWNGTTRHIVKTAKAQLSPITLVQYCFNAYDLYHRPFGGEGKYYVAWYIGSDEEPVRREEFSLKK